MVGDADIRLGWILCANNKFYGSFKLHYNVKVFIMINPLGTVFHWIYLIQKMKEKHNLLFWSILGSLIIIGISAIHKVNLTLPGVQKFGYGFPFSWLKQSTVVYPNAPTVWSIQWLELIANIVIWWLILAIVLYILKRWVFVKEGKGLGKDV